MHRIFIDGKEGTTGLRIFDRLAKCADIEVISLDDSERKDSAKRKECIAASDITFLCLPDAAARESVALAEGSKARIIDASTAHRTAPGWVYGFPELRRSQRDAVKESKRVAVPGCHASGFLALTVPLLDAGLLPTDALLSCFSITGYSGGGKSLIAEYESPARDVSYDSTRAYALSQQHKHLREMQHVSGLSVLPVFSPVQGDFYAGMHITIPLHAAMLRQGTNMMDALGALMAHYAGNPLVYVKENVQDGAILASNAYAGLDTMELSVAGNDERFCLMARYDNLGKGASGAAVQCMNLMLGRPETESLAQF